jgi:Cas7 group CRISPR-associated protein Csh2
MTNFNRGTGLLVIEARGSNPNGDPDAEGEPRTIGADRRGLISPVSFKRKLRDLVGDGEVMRVAAASLKLNEGNQYSILETREYRNDDTVIAMNRDQFVTAHWDARVFGSTLLQENQTQSGKRHFITTGTVQFGPGISIAPIDIEYGTWTSKAGVESDKDRGMAPLAWRFVPHAVYVMPFFVNPIVGAKSGCTADDIRLMQYVIPYAYRATASTARPHVEILHAWYADHTSPLGSCPDHLIVDAMTPTKVRDADQPSRSIGEYEVPTELPVELRQRLASFEDLCDRELQREAA